MYSIALGGTIRVKGIVHQKGWLSGIRACIRSARGYMTNQDSLCRFCTV